MICAYCNGTKGQGWDDCPEAIKAKARLTNALKGIDETMRGGREYWGTHDEQKRLETMATGIKLNGGEVREFKCD